MGTERVIAVLDQALHNHQAWATALHRRLIAGLPPAADDVSAASHRVCAFGRWYQDEVRCPDLSLAGLPAFEAIGRVHEQMHAHARALLCTPPGDARLGHYDRFAEASERLAAQVRALQQQMLTRLLSLDPLTGLPGRRNMVERLTLAWLQAQKEQVPAVVAMMDVDLFKHVNDEFGHAAGDAVLRWLGEGARRQLRSHDLVFRYGGEEFLAYLGDSTLDSALGTLERIRRAIEAAAVPLPDGRSVRLTASFGLSACVPGCPVEQTIEQADRALYEAKRAGRNRVVCWRAGTFV